MNNINQHLYAIYRNIVSFYDYRGLVSLSEELQQDGFIKAIQKDKYLMLASVNKSDVAGEVDKIDPQKMASAEDKYRVTVVLLVYPGTECESKRANMLKMLNRIAYTDVDVLIITPIKISTSISKGLHAMSNEKRSFRAFTYTLFNSVLPEHELVPKYEILDQAQINQIKECFIDPDTLPRVFENDPQMVWLGAKNGDVVKFVYPSEITIESIGYCKVISSI